MDFTRCYSSDQYCCLVLLQLARTITVALAVKQRIAIATGVIVREVIATRAVIAADIATATTYKRSLSSATVAVDDYRLHLYSECSRFTKGWALHSLQLNARNKVTFCYSKLIFAIACSCLHPSLHQVANHYS